MSHLRHAKFFGVSARHLEAGYFKLAVMRPTVPPEHMETHSHEGAHFVLVLAGAYRSTAFGCRGVCHGPSLIYNPPGTEHRDTFVDLDGRFLTISLPAEHVSAAGEIRSPGEPLYCDDPRQLRRALAVYQACTRGVPDPLHVESLALELLDNTRAIAAPERLRPPWLDRAVELLRDRAAERLSLRSIAAELGVHPVHLTRVFRQHLHQTPGRFRRVCRLGRAASLLCGGDEPLATLALDAGFGDQSHLSRVFHAFYGVSPGRFRENVSFGQDGRPAGDAR